MWFVTKPTGDSFLGSISHYSLSIYIEKKHWLNRNKTAAKIASMSKVTIAICKEAVNVAMETTLQACGS